MVTLALTTSMLGSTIIVLPFLENRGIRLQSVLFCLALIVMTPALYDRTTPTSLPSARPLTALRMGWWALLSALALATALVGGPQGKQPWDGALIGIGAVTAAFRVGGVLPAAIAGLGVGLVLMGTYVPEAGDGSAAPSKAALVGVAACGVWYSRDRAKWIGA